MTAHRPTTHASQPLAATPGRPLSLPRLNADSNYQPIPAGTPVTITLPVLPGYSVRPGTDTAAGLGYKCAESLLLYSCLLQGSVEVRLSLLFVLPCGVLPPPGCPLAYTLAAVHALLTHCPPQPARQLASPSPATSNHSALPSLPMHRRSWPESVKQTRSARRLCTCPTVSTPSVRCAPLGGLLFFATLCCSLLLPC